MKTRNLLLAVLAGTLLAIPAAAQTVDTSFKVKLTNGVEIVSATAPKPSGSMLLVKNLSDGSLVAIPVELVANVAKTKTGTSIEAKTAKSFLPAARLVTVADSATGAKSVVVLPEGQKASLSTAKMARTLAGADAPATLAGGKGVILSGNVSAAKTPASLTGALAGARAFAGLAKTDSVMMTSISPGQTIFLGPTGGTTTTAAATRIGTAAAASTLGLTPNTLSANSSASSIQDQIFVGDLPRLTPNAGLAAGMVTPTTGEVVIGPNGFPTPVTKTNPAGSVPIGPNGFPDVAAARGVGTNGFPTTGSAAATTGLTPAARGITTVPATVSPATAATAGALATPGTTVGPTSAAAPAAASPR